MRGATPLSLANLDSLNRAQHGAWSVERGRPAPPWLPWAADAEALVTCYYTSLPVEADCHLCEALAHSTARARCGLFCVEAYGKANAVPFVGRNGVRRLYNDLAKWEDRWLERLTALEKQRAEAHQAKPDTPNAMAYLKAISTEGDTA